MAFQSSQLYTLIHHSKWQLTVWVGVQEFTSQYVRGKRKNKWWLSLSNNQPNQNIFCEHQHQTKGLINPLDSIVPWITHTKYKLYLVFLIMIYECEFYLRNPQLHLCALISLLHVIPSAPHCLPLSMAFQSSQLYTLIHHSKWQLTSCARVYIAVCAGERERTSDDYHYQTTNLIRTFFVNTNTRQRLINPLDSIVPWITHKIQTILVFLIMIYECEFYLRNPQLHLYALISLLHVIPSAPHCLPLSMAFQSSQLYTLIHHSKWQLTSWVGVQEFTLQYVRGKRKNKWWLSLVWWFIKRGASLIKQHTDLPCNWWMYKAGFVADISRYADKSSRPQVVQVSHTHAQQLQQLLLVFLHMYKLSFTLKPWHEPNFWSL